MRLTEGDGGTAPMKVPYTMAGQCGGWIFQNTRHGQVRYRKFIPFDPNTLAQQRVRKNFGGVGKRWKTLSDWHHQLWNEEAARHLTRERLGQCGPMTGWNYWHQVNVRRANRGLPVFDLPPEYLQRLEAALSRALSWVGAAQPLLGPALFLQASRRLMTRTVSTVGSPAGLPPPRPSPEPTHS